MLNKSRLVKLLKNKLFYQKYCGLSLTANPKALLESSPDSYRKKEWLASREIYKDHEKLLYSSVLELENLRKIKEHQYGPKERKAKEAFFYYKNKKEGKTQKDSNSFDQQMDISKNWMDDYEFYEGGVDESGSVNSTYGTADPSIPPSKVPCNGCGAHLHCAKSSLPGYIPKEIFGGRSNDELQTIICQRCHFLKYYNIALDVEVAPETYIETISQIKNEYALAIVIIDLLDVPCSIWPGMQDLLGSKRPVFIVGNKVDLLPRDSNGYLNNVKRVLTDQIKKYGGFDAMNIKYVSLISAKTGFGIEELITQLHKIWKHKGNVYLMGCTNVGKSSLFNVLLNSDYCRPEASDLVKKATICPWPGTTLQMLKFPILRPSDHKIYLRFQRLFSEKALKAAEAKLRRDQAQKTGSIQAAKLIGRIGRTFDKRNDTLDQFSAAQGTKPIVTFNEKRLEYKEARWCFDTPGVMHPDQITNLLTTEELLKIEPEEMIFPRAFRLPYETSVLLAGLGRLDFTGFTFESSIEWLKIYIFASHKLPITIVPTKEADKVYENYLGSQLLGVPFGSTERLKEWPGLQRHREEIRVSGSEEKFALSCDIVFSSAGWIGVDIPNGAQCSFEAWSPLSRGIYVRQPALIRQADRLVGKRVRNSLAYNLGIPFVFKK